MRPGLTAALLAASALWAFLPGLPAPASFDDGVLGAYADKLSSPGAVWRAFRDPVPLSQQGARLPAYAYRPLTELSLALSGSRLPGLRLGNLAIHICVAGMAFLLVRRLAPGAAPWAGAFLLLHPFAAHTVIYVYQRAIGLETALSFACVLLYLRGRTAWAWMLGLLAMTAKETAVTLPLLLAVVEGFGERKWRRWLPFAALPILPLVQVLRAAWAARGILPVGAGLESGFRPVVSGPGVWEYFRMELPIVLGYLRATALPFPLHFYHDRILALPGQPLPLSWTATLLAGGALAGALAWILLGPRRHALPRLGLALFLAPLALESSVFPIQDAAFFHRCYPSLLGAGLLFGWAARRLRPPVALAALALMAFSLRGECATWSRPSALLRRDVRSAWHRTQCWGNYAWSLQERGMVEGASRLFRHALTSPWQNAGTRTGMACALRGAGRKAEARREMDAAMRDFPRDPALVWMSVVHALEDGDEARARALADRAEALPVLSPELLLWTAHRRLEEGKPLSARKLLERHLAYYPTRPDVLELLERSKGEADP